MKSLFIGIAVFLLILGVAEVVSAKAKIVGKAVEYHAQGMLMKGFMAYDENMKEKRPGIMVVPEWWGMNDYVKRRVRMLAELGYVAMAVDMYGGGKVVSTPDEAGKLSSAVMKDFDVGKARFMSAMDFLKQQPMVDPGKIAAIGYCFGGGVVLNMARQGTELKGVVSFHGGLTAVQPARPGSVKAKILVLNGGADKLATQEQIEAFKQEMKSAATDYTFISYPGALHAFTNPETTALGKKFNLPIAYNAKADKASWAEMKNFLKDIFR